MPYASNGTLVTDKREVAIDTTWDTQTDWTAYQSASNVVVNNGIVSLDDTPIEPSGISQEEDGDLAEYSGDTGFFSVDQSQTISGSDYSISFSTDGTLRYIGAPFTGGEYSSYSMYVYPAEPNNELMLYDSSNGNVVFGIYFRNNDIQGIYYSGSNSTAGGIQNSGATSRTGGVELVGSSSVASQWYHIELLNIDWSAETLDIAVDGTTVASNVGFILSGTPDAIQLNSNAGSSVTAGYVDKVDIS